MSKILDDLIACGASSDTILTVAKLIADAELTSERRQRNRDRMAAVRARAPTRLHTETHKTASIEEERKKEERKILDRAARKRAIQIPPDFQPALEWAMEKRKWSPEEATEQAARFRDHYLANGKPFIDWPAVWRNWVTSPYQTKGNGNGHHGQPPRPHSREARIERTSAAWENSSTPQNKAILLIRQLLSGYPSLKDVHDPEGYFTNLCSLLTMYAEEDAVAGCRAVADSGGEFPPSRFTLRQALEKAAADRWKAGRWDRYAQERKAADAKAIAGPPEHRQTVAEIRAEMTARGFPMPDPAKGRPHGETAASVQKKFGLTPEQWAAIPDAAPAGSWERLVASHRDR